MPPGQFTPAGVSDRWYVSEVIHLMADTRLEYCAHCLTIRARQGALA
jgi:hypothetical protein